MLEELLNRQLSAAYVSRDEKASLTDYHGHLLRRLDAVEGRVRDGGPVEGTERTAVAGVLPSSFSLSGDADRGSLQEVEGEESVHRRDEALEGDAGEEGSCALVKTEEK